MQLMPPLHVDVLSPDEALSRWEPEWLRLANESENATCFALPAYFRAWHRTLAHDVEGHVIAVHCDDRLCGIMPVMAARVWRGPSCAPRHDYAPSDRSYIRSGWPRLFRLRQLSSVVSLPATMLGPTPLCRTDATATVTRAIASALVRFPRWDVIVLQTYEDIEQSSWLTAFEGIGLRPRIHSLGRIVQGLQDVRPFNNIVSEQSRNFRRNIARARAAAGEFDMEFSVQEGRVAVARHLDMLAAVAKASWKHLGRDDTSLLIPYAGAQQEFFERLLQDHNLGASPVLGIATVRGDPISVQLCIRHGSNLTGLLTFRNDRCGAASPSILLLGHMIDWAVDQNIARFDFNTTHEWLRHLADERRSCNNVVIFASTVAGRLFGLVSKAAQSWR
jgi:CelD/BcsL family acetyltransferase involved in cellulose biosynthesis